MPSRATFARYASSRPRSSARTASGAVTAVSESRARSSSSSASSSRPVQQRREPVPLRGAGELLGRAEPFVQRRRRAADRGHVRGEDLRQHLDPGAARLGEGAVGPGHHVAQPLEPVLGVVAHVQHGLHLAADVLQPPAGLLVPRGVRPARRRLRLPERQRVATRCAPAAGSTPRRAAPVRPPRGARPAAPRPSAPASAPAASRRPAGLSGPAAPTTPSRPPPPSPSPGRTRRSSGAAAPPG